MDRPSPLEPGTQTIIPFTGLSPGTQMRRATFASGLLEGAGEGLIEFLSTESAEDATMKAQNVYSYCVDAEEAIASSRLGLRFGYHERKAKEAVGFQAAFTFDCTHGKDHDGVLDMDSLHPSAGGEPDSN